MLKTLALISLVYFAWRFISMLTAGIGGQGSGGDKQGYKFKKSGKGEVKVKYNPKSSDGRNATDGIGDYVDYEEVKD